jgi:RNA polymerase sigma-70 factor (ECF subfamily)
MTTGKSGVEQKNSDAFTEENLFHTEGFVVQDSVGGMQTTAPPMKRKLPRICPMIETLTTGYAICRRRIPKAASAAPEKPVAIIEAMSLEQLPDEELVAQYRSTAEVRQREQYVDELFRRNYNRVARWCLRFTDDRESAADLAQEIFSKAYQKLSSFQGQSKFSTWLFVIARNHCLNAVRANARQATELKADDGEAILLGIADHSPNPHSLMEQTASAQLVRKLLSEALDETEKMVFTLHYGEEVPLDAITRLLQLENQSGAKAYIVSAKRKLGRLCNSGSTRPVQRNLSEARHDGSGHLEIVVRSDTGVPDASAVGSFGGRKEESPASGRLPALPGRTGDVEVV